MADSLSWCKTSAVRFPAVAKVAKDMLGIQALLVASKSTFSILGTLIDRTRSMLCDDYIISLINAQVLNSIFSVKHLFLFIFVFILSTEPTVFGPSRFSLALLRMDRAFRLCPRTTTNIEKKTWPGCTARRLIWANFLSNCGTVVRTFWESATSGLDQNRSDRTKPWSGSDCAYL